MAAPAPRSPFLSEAPTSRALFLVLYTRVSTHDQQTLPLSLEAMRPYVAQHSWTVVTKGIYRKFSAGGVFCPFLSMCMSSMPADVGWAVSNALNPGVSARARCWG
jgi:hypothetical protein